MIMKRSRDITIFFLSHHKNHIAGHAVEPSKEEEDSTTNEVFYPGYPGTHIHIHIQIYVFISYFIMYSSSQATQATKPIPS